MRVPLLVFATITGALLFPMLASAQPILTSMVESGDPTLPDTEFVVALIVSGNSTPIVTYALRVSFDLNNVSFLGAQDGTFGAQPRVGAGDLPSQRDINQSNSGSTFTGGILFRCRFRTNAALFPPYSISFSNDPASSAPLLANDFFSAIPHDFDNSATLNLGASAEEECSIPDAPKNMRAFPGATSVLLQWEPNDEFDLEGYFVYRGTSEGGLYERITPNRLSLPRYVDTGHTMGDMFYPDLFTDPIT